MVHLNHALVCVEEGWQPKKHFFVHCSKMLHWRAKNVSVSKIFSIFNSNKYLKGQRRVCEHTCIQMCVPNT